MAVLGGLLGSLEYMLIFDYAYIMNLAEKLGIKIACLSLILQDENDQTSVGFKVSVCPFKIMQGASSDHLYVGIFSRHQLFQHFIISLFFQILKSMKVMGRDEEEILTF